MKKSSRASRRNLEPRLRAYSTSTTAALATAGAVTLGVTATASAQTVIGNLTLNNAASSSLVTVPSTPGHATFHFAAPAFSGQQLRLRADFFTSSYNGHHSSNRVLRADGSHGTNIHGSTNIAFNAVRAFAHGQALSMTNRVGGAGFFNKGVSYSGSHFSGGLLKPTVGNTRTGYIAFGFYGNGTGYLGWLHIRVTGSGGNPATVSFLDNGDGIIGAYGLMSHPITAGATAIPEPTTVATGLALFALGAAGVREHRKRRQLAA